MSKTKKLPNRAFIQYFQYFMIPFFKIIQLVTVSSKIVRTHSNDIDSDSDYIIVSNHQGYLDAYLVCYALSFQTHLKLGPYRFFLANKFLRFWILRIILVTFGCFPSHKHDNYPYGLEYAQKLADDNQTVMIFPEGKISKYDRQYPPRNGVVKLANRDNMMVIPARLIWNRKKGIFRSYKISIGSPFDGQGMDAQQLIDKVYELRFDN